MPGYKNFSKIDKLMKETAKQYHLEAAVYRYKALKAWEQVAAGFIEEVKELAKAIDFKKGVLKVACLTRDIATKIKVLAERLIHALNQFLGKQIVYAISVEV